MKWLRLLFLMFTLPLLSQTGFQATDRGTTVVPFQFINNLILIPVNINGVDLTFLLDSGVAETLLFSLESKKVNFSDVEKVKFSGLGENLEIEGLKAINNKVKIGKNFVDNQHQIYIILNEDFNFSSHIGVPVNGIIGYQFFKNNRVKIDFVSKKITVFHQDKKFSKEAKRYSTTSMSIELNKPYITARVQQTDNEQESKLLIDLGNSDAVWLFPSLIPGFIYNRPNIDDYLGRGFNGDIYGKRSRIHGFYLGNQRLEKPLAAMPDEYSIQNLKLVKDRKGSVGNEILRRFAIIFDYTNGKFYFRKNQFVDDPFHFNMSGLDIKNDGMYWDTALVEVQNAKNEKPSSGIDVPVSSNKFQYKFVLKPAYSVSGVRVDSPAYRSGIRKGDKILKINGKNTSEMTLQKINDFFKSEEGRTVNLAISRNEKVSNFVFYLEDPIPYQEP